MSSSFCPSILKKKLNRNLHNFNSSLSPSHNLIPNKETLVLTLFNSKTLKPPNVYLISLDLKKKLGLLKTRKSAVPGVLCLWSGYVSFSSDGKFWVPCLLFFASSSVFPTDRVERAGPLLHQTSGALLWTFTAGAADNAFKSHPWVTVQSCTSSS